jgi:hypothetical protein
MPLCATVEALAFFEQRLSLFVGEERRSIVLPSRLLDSSAAWPRGIYCVHVHCVVTSPPALSLAFQSLFPSVLIVTKEWVGEGGFVFHVRRVMRPGRLVPLL